MKKESKVLFFQCDTRDNHNNYIEYSSKINTRYCLKHKYDYQYIKIQPNDRHPSWSKILISIDLIKKYKYHQYVYLDSDVIIKNHAISLYEYLQNAQYKIFTTQSDITFLNDKPFHYNLPCAGIFMFNNNALSFLNKWYKTKNSFYFKRYPWEQKELWSLIKKYPINIIDDWMFQNRSNDQYFLHIPSYKNEQRESIFKYYLDNN